MIGHSAVVTNHSCLTIGFLCQHYFSISLKWGVRMLDKYGIIVDGIDLMDFNNNEVLISFKISRRSLIIKLQPLEARPRILDVILWV
jgi:hypothetical protein